MNGIMPRSLSRSPNLPDGALVPDSAYLNWRQLRELLDPSRTTDARLAQALSDAREQVEGKAELLASGMRTHLKVLPEDIVRALLPSHTCKAQHSVAQAMLPRAVLEQIDPATSSVDAQWVGDPFAYLVNAADSPFLKLLADGMAEIGGWLGASGS
jgi:hypothetical protein